MPDRRRAVVVLQKAGATMSERCIAAFALAILLSGTQVLAREPGSHVHGSATLQIAVDGPAVQVMFETPLDNLLGFERAPRTPPEQQAARAMRATLQRPEGLLVFTPEAGCVPEDTQIKAPVLDPDPGAAGAHGPSSHAALQAEVMYLCRRPSALTSVDVRLFDAFSAMHTLRAQVAGPRGQTGAVLTSKQRRLSW